MSFRDLAEAYQGFKDAYGDPACCGQVHWKAARLEAWLREEGWDGDWESLEPALVVKAAKTAWDDYCAD